MQKPPSLSRGRRLYNPLSIREAMYLRLRYHLTSLWEDIRELWDVCQCLGARCFFGDDTFVRVALRILDRRISENEDKRAMIADYKSDVLADPDLDDEERGEYLYNLSTWQRHYITQDENLHQLRRRVELYW